MELEKIVNKNKLEMNSVISMYTFDSNVGSSGYMTYLTDPQPLPDLMVKTPYGFGMASTGKCIPNSPSSVAYINKAGQLLGGIVGLNPEEMEVLSKKHSE